MDRGPTSVIWLRPERGTRGPTPGLTRAGIAAVAVALADREGFAAVSMRRLAAELGTSASALYRYLDRKDDLLNLMVDAVLTARVTPSGDWRADLRAMAVALRDGFLTHPWLVHILAGRPTLGPNRLAATESALAVFDTAGVPARDRLAILDTMTSFVRGYASSEIADRLAIAASGLPAAQWRRDQDAYARVIADSGAYPRLTAVFGENAGLAPEDVQDANFSFGLGIILDGVAARLANG